ncbi:ABC transporter substrate-binding protein [Paenibacillus sp. S150]|uniref:ABC transporter substrate-binding protein n=1 Tax=Paenibacillus sp. S150 TaxID=2749826 RepID=UPI001E2B8F26|nr:extracellular solute-binding protein [Paenibacillus sp. S150]
MLSACSNSKPTEASSTTSQAPAASPEVTAKPEEKKTLEFWHTYTGEKEKIFNEAIARFEQKHTDVEVKAVQAANDAYKQKFAVAMSAGNPPDVFQSWGGGWLEEFVNQGKVLDLSAKIDTNAYEPTVLNNTVISDKTYGVPLGLTITLFFYNKDLFNQYGLTAPATWEEFLNTVDVLRKNKIIPIALENQAKWPGAYYLMYLADRIAGPELFQSASKRTGQGFDDPAYVKAGQLIQELVDHDAFNKGFNSINTTSGQGRQLLYSGQAGMMLYNTNFVDYVKNESPDFLDKLDFFPFPTVDGGAGDASNLNAAASPVWSVSATSEHPDLAVELLKELSSTETAQAYSDRISGLVGVKGVDYNDPIAKRLAEYVSKAKSIHWPYDQVLPPELAEVHKDTTQALFSKTETPEEAAAKVEAKAKEVFGK